MSRLTTVATFDLVAKAEIARNILEESGIDAVITDAEIVAMDWLFANAVGGIKVQVRVADAERAAAVLDEQLETAAGQVTEGIDEEELARQALAAGEADEVTDEVSEEEPARPESEAEQPDESRDAYAQRMFLAAMFSIIFPPLWFYAFYLLLNAAFGPGPLSDRGRTRLYVGAGMVLLPLLFWMAILSAVGGVTDWLPYAW